MNARGTAKPRVVLVTGAAGFIGRGLIRTLLGKGDRVIVPTRNWEGARPAREIAVSDLETIGNAERIDAVVDLADPRIAASRRNRRLPRTRLDTPCALMRLFDRLDRKPGVLISVSDVGYYGRRGDEVLTERSPPRRGHPSRQCASRERAARRAERHGVRVCLLRVGAVLDFSKRVEARSPLPMPPGAAPLAGDGEGWAPWIDLRDLVRLVAFLLVEDAICGAVNAVAPEVVRHGQLMRAIRGRPLALPMPASPPRRDPDEATGQLLDGQLVVPAVALGAGFQFHHPRLAEALDSTLAPTMAASRHTTGRAS